MERAPNHWLAAVGVLAAGFASAMLFHEEGPATTALTAPVGGNGNDLPWTGEPLTLRVPSVEDASAEAPTAGSTVVPRTTLMRTPDLDTPPSIEGEYGGLLHQYGGRPEKEISTYGTPSPAGPARLSITPTPTTARPASGIAPPSPAPNRPVPANSASDTPPRGTSVGFRGIPTSPQPTDTRTPLGRDAGPAEDDAVEPLEPRPKRRHVVRDGDTLAGLAQRYYGDADWAPRIYAANREVLKDPDLLPVGQTLVLPSEVESVGDQPLAPLKESPPLAPAPANPATSPSPAAPAPSAPIESSPRPAAQTQLAPLG